MKAIVQDANMAGVRPRITAEGEEVDAWGSCMLGRGKGGMHDQGDCDRG